MWLSYSLIDEEAQPLDPEDINPFEDFEEGRKIGKKKMLKLQAKEEKKQQRLVCTWSHLSFQNHTQTYNDCRCNFFIKTLNELTGVFCYFHAIISHECTQKFCPLKTFWKCSKFLINSEFFPPQTLGWRRRKEREERARGSPRKTAEEGGRNDEGWRGCQGN